MVVGSLRQRNWPCAVDEMVLPGCVRSEPAVQERRLPLPLAMVNVPSLASSVSVKTGRISQR